jgi:hypothetical protein
MPNCGGNIARLCPQNLALGAGWIILVEACDFFEERRAAFVVKRFGGQLWWGVEEPLNDFVERECAGLRWPMR